MKCLERLIRWSLWNLRRRTGYGHASLNSHLQLVTCKVLCLQLVVLHLKILLNLTGDILDEVVLKLLLVKLCVLFCVVFVVLKVKKIHIHALALLKRWEGLFHELFRIVVLGVFSKFNDNY